MPPILRRAALLFFVCLSVCSCRTARESDADTRSTIVLDDGEPESRESANDFASAFALDTMCHGLSLRRFNQSGFSYPSTPYWALDVFYADAAVPADDRKMLWTIAHGGGKAEGYATGTELSAKDAAHSVCLIVQGKGGSVR